MSLDGIQPQRVVDSMPLQITQGQKRDIQSFPAGADLMWSHPLEKYVVWRVHAFRSPRFVSLLGDKGAARPELLLSFPSG